MSSDQRLFQPRTAMILAAGKGTRMRPLTMKTPKPLLKAGGKPLIAWHIERLVRAGFKKLVINHCWLGEQLEQAVGDGSAWGIEILWSREDALLETGGGIAHARPLLGAEPFLLVNGDVFTNIDFRSLALQEGRLAHLVMVQNPEHNPRGDFVLSKGQLSEESPERRQHSDTSCDSLTYSGVGIIAPRLLSGCPEGAFPLAPWLRKAMKQASVTGELHTGYWLDVGTPERLQQLAQDLEQDPLLQQS